MSYRDRGRRKKGQALHDEMRRASANRRVRKSPVMAGTKKDADAARAKVKRKPAKKFNVGVSKGGVSFSEAFKHFKKKGNKTFTWNGAKYTTETAAAKKATAKKLPKKSYIDKRFDATKKDLKKSRGRYGLIHALRSGKW
mgnify:CR=1 FL=1